MKVFVTVGTGKFEKLIIALDRMVGHEIVFQIGRGRYLPRNHRYFRFSEDISKHYRSADLIISHAGIGTIFEVLHIGKPLIVVPNTDRTDRHQLEIVRRLKKEDYFILCTDIDELGSLIRGSCKLKKYSAPENKIAERIKGFLR